MYPRKGMKFVYLTGKAKGKKATIVGFSEWGDIHIRQPSGKKIWVSKMDLTAWLHEEPKRIKWVK